MQSPQSSSSVPPPPNSLCLNMSSANDSATQITRSHRKSHDERISACHTCCSSISAQGLQHAATCVLKGFRSALLSLLICSLRAGIEGEKECSPETSLFGRAREYRQYSNAVCFLCSMLTCTFCHLRLGFIPKIGYPLWSSS